MNSSLSLTPYLRSIWHVFSQNWRLILLMTRRDIFEPHIGQVFGRFWVFGHPVLLISVYAIAFNLIFKARVGGTYELPLDYTTYILSGLIPWMAFQQSMARGAQAITSNAILVKQVVFPVEVLPIKGCLAGSVILPLGLIFLLIYTVVGQGYLPWTYVLLPVLIAISLVAMVGMAFLLASIGVFVRDVRDILQVFSVVNIYLMPAIYLPEWVPDVFRVVLYFNPFSYLVWCYQDILYFGRIEHPWAWLVLTVGSGVTFAAGYRVFHQLRPHLGDAL